MDSNVKKVITRLAHGDVLTFVSDYVVGDLVKFGWTPKGNYIKKDRRTEYSRIQRVIASIKDGNTIELQYKMENGRVVDHIDIIAVEKKA